MSSVVAVKVRMLLINIYKENQMKKLSKEQIIDQLEDGIEQLKKIFSEAVIETEQERIIRKNRIIAKLERENEILRTKLDEKKTNSTSKLLYLGFSKKTLTLPQTPINKHLGILSNILRCRKNSRMPGYTSHEIGIFIMDFTLQQVVTINCIQFSRGNFHPQFFRRIVLRILHPERLENPDFRQSI